MLLLRQCGNAYYSGERDVAGEQPVARGRLGALGRGGVGALRALVWSLKIHVLGCGALVKGMWPESNMVLEGASVHSDGEG